MAGFKLTSLFFSGSNVNTIGTTINITVTTASIRTVAPSCVPIRPATPLSHIMVRIIGSRNLIVNIHFFPTCIDEFSLSIGTIFSIL